MGCGTPSTRLGLTESSIFCDLLLLAERMAMEALRDRSVLLKGVWADDPKLAGFGS